MAQNRTILTIINNEENMYEGNLRHYFKIVFNAPNVEAPYHNFRHMLHVTWEAYDAGIYYRMNVAGRQKFRALLIAALMHDYGHAGVMGDDFKNIKTALDAVENYILPEDQDLLPEIKMLISATEHPHVRVTPNLFTQIIRDADMSQVFSNEAWIQQIAFGLTREFKKELNMTPVEFLQKQLEFVPVIEFNTEWARFKYDSASDSKREKRLAEIRGLLEILQ